MRWPRFAVVAAFAYFTDVVQARPASDKFLLMSAPRSSQIAYSKISSRVGLKRGRAALGPVKILVNFGLVHPQGIAIDSRRGRLLVADPDSKKIFAYSLRVQGDAELVVGTQEVVADNVEARWVTLDSNGNMFFSDEGHNKIFFMTVASVENATKSVELLQEGSSTMSVSAPGGIAVDNFATYWVNKRIGTQSGSVVRAPLTVHQRRRALQLSQVVPGIEKLASNTDKSYGVCLAMDNIFYSQPESILYGVKKPGRPGQNRSAPQLVSDRFRNPRGCVWDGDGTLYVADRGANAIYSFASNMQKIGATDITFEGQFEDAFGLAIYRVDYDQHSFSSSPGAARLSLRAAAVALCVLVSALQ